LKPPHAAQRSRPHPRVFDSQADEYEQHCGKKWAGASRQINTGGPSDPGLIPTSDMNNTWIWAAALASAARPYRTFSRVELGFRIYLPGCWSKRATKERLHRAGMPKAPLYLSDGGTPDSVFDLVVSVDVFAYIGRLVRGVRRGMPVIAPDGLFAFSTEEAGADAGRDTNSKHRTLYSSR